jgi:hypothetical protein
MRSDYAYDVYMDTDFTGDWIDCIVKDTLMKRILTITSAQIFWSDASGSPTGIIQVLASNDADTPTLLSAYTVDTADNTDNAELILIDPVSDKISFRFLHNGMTAGRFSIILNYSPL